MQFFQEKKNHVDLKDFFPYSPVKRRICGYDALSL